MIKGLFLIIGICLSCTKQAGTLKIIKYKRLTLEEIHKIESSQDIGLDIGCYEITIKNDSTSTAYIPVRNKVFLVTNKEVYKEDGKDAIIGIPENFDAKECISLMPNDNINLYGCFLVNHKIKTIEIKSEYYYDKCFNTIHYLTYEFKI